MKIALIVNPLIPVPPEKYGGIERIVFMLTQQLQKRGHEVTLYANAHSQPGCKLIPYHESGVYSKIDFIRINALTAKIAFGGFDLVHTFGRMNNIALLMATRLPKIISYQLQPTLSQAKKAVKIAPTGSLHFTACSDFIANQIKDVATVTTIYNGVDLDDYEFAREVQPDAPLVFLGRIQHEKGTAVAIKIAQLTGNKLIIAGNIPAEELHQKYFTEQVEPHIDNDRIKYIGAVNDQQKNELLGKAKAFLMPILWDEPFGIVMAEALACGTPVIGFNRGSVPEVVTNGLNGYVCDIIDEIVTAVNNADKINRADCRRVAEQKFSAEILGAQYESLYRQILAK